MNRGFARWRVEPLRNQRRTVVERLALAAPRPTRWLTARTARVGSGSRLRRAALTRMLLVGVAANNRLDYEALSAFLHPEVELHMPSRRGAGMDPVYCGREGYLIALQLWKEPFSEFRWEVLEMFDPGGDRFAARTDMVGRGRESGLELREPQFNVWQLADGFVWRQWAFTAEDEMLERLLDG